MGYYEDDDDAAGIRDEWDIDYSKTLTRSDDPGYWMLDGKEVDFRDRRFVRIMADPFPILVDNPRLLNRSVALNQKALDMASKDAAILSWKNRYQAPDMARATISWLMLIGFVVIAGMYEVDLTVGFLSLVVISVVVNLVYILASLFLAYRDFDDWAEYVLDLRAPI
jgi:hypothetical protein